MFSTRFHRRHRRNRAMLVNFGKFWANFHGKKSQNINLINIV